MRITNHAMSDKEEFEVSSTILYIEDNPDNALLIERAVAALGHKFVWAETGQSGLEMAETDSPDLILLDINLPDIDGYEVAQRLRNGKNRLPQVPIIAITANALKGDAEKALEAGCDDYMAKPINVKDFWTRMKTLLPNS